MPPWYLQYADLRQSLLGTPLAPLCGAVPDNLIPHIEHGDFPRWRATLDALPKWQAAQVELLNDVILQRATPLSDEEQRALRHTLLGLHPWRKGPYDFFGVYIDTEWRSDWKWNRLLPHITPLTNRQVLDVGCGNGYHCWRMAGAGASFVLGVEPMLLFNLQYWALRKYLPHYPAHVLPLTLEQMPDKLAAFDTVFSMGVLYHRRSPFDHLQSLKNALRPGGELVLETLVVEGPRGQVLVPEGRYSRMPNVWFLPSPATLESWLIKAGFREARVVDVNLTSTEEQRPTAWMSWESLPQDLDPRNPDLTVEGHPRPRRAIVVAEKPR
ncbi:MAG: tRNA 5-methoxyuridine(34)/uridine 5-oxyacetic acid(34) synthase CmoB [Pseudomonadales bacterium]|jgi:tRNA (mo5U34)-methyltransferase|nr:tRNA 5-methoxyuridine(34)/uridine 5-oxyacetic acid(34) synthase CmoB [Pseudomonadales bacterium]